jgi:GT2 family glycosyltransferase
MHATMEKNRPIAYFCGAGFAMRRAVFCEMGYFWEPLIYGGEELDLSCRLMNAGYQIVYAASVQVAHYEVATVRPKGQWIFYQARNRCWVAVRNLPWHFAFSITLLWWACTGWVSLKHHEVNFFIKGVRHALAGLPFALRELQRLRNPAIIAIRRLSGRLWY